MVRNRPEFKLLIDPNRVSRTLVTSICVIRCRRTNRPNSADRQFSRETGIIPSRQRRSTHRNHFRQRTIEGTPVLTAAVGNCSARIVNRKAVHFHRMLRGQPALRTDHGHPRGNHGIQPDVRTPAAGCGPGPQASRSHPAQAVCRAHPEPVGVPLFRR